MDGHLKGRRNVQLIVGEATMDWESSEVVDLVVALEERALKSR